MALIKWRDSYSVGVEQFDQEHKVILNLINEMFEVVKEKDVEMPFVYEVDELIKYTKVHFTNEEAALEAAGVPFLAEHRKIHKKMVQDVLDYHKRVTGNSHTVASDFYLFLRDWLRTHILEEDMKYKGLLS